MKEDFSELVEYLDEKFSGIGVRFDRVDERIGNVEDKIEAVQHSFDMDVFLRGRNPVSGY